MPINLSTVVRTALMASIETAIAANAILHINTGAVPATPATNGNGTLLANMALGADYFAAAANGAVAKTGAGWVANAANANGTAGHFRIYASDGTTCHIQGNCTNTGNGGDMTLDNVVIAVNQTVTITGFTLTAPNA